LFHVASFACFVFSFFSFERDEKYEHNKKEEIFAYGIVVRVDRDATRGELEVNAGELVGVVVEEEAIIDVVNAFVVIEGGNMDAGVESRRDGVAVLLVGLSDDNHHQDGQETQKKNHGLHIRNSSCFLF